MHLVAPMRTIGSALVLASVVAGSVASAAPRPQSAFTVSVATAAAAAASSSDSAPATLIERAPIAPELASADRLAGRLHGELRIDSRTELRVCMRPSGKVTNVTTLAGTNLALDAALVEDVSRWTFSKLPGPDTVQSCEQVTVVYHPHK